MGTITFMRGESDCRLPAIFIEGLSLRLTS
jgi:hypothetical protein